MRAPSLLFATLIALAALVCLQPQPEVSCQSNPLPALNITSLVSSLLNLPYDALSELFVNILPATLGFQPGNINGSLSQNMPLAFNDSANDGITFLTAQQILVRSGYQFENYNVTSDDGFITQIIRIVNRFADRTKLKPFPVVMFHGGLIDPRFYLLPSAIQHHPERYPRTAADGPITSSNRSIPLMLANNGYDVFLVGTRGCNEDNSGRTPAGQLAGPFPSTAYWRFKMDDISQKEVENQVNRVLNVTGKQKVDMFTYSLSTMTSLQAFAARPEFPRTKVHTYVALAPVISNEGSSYFTKTLVDICINTPLDVGIGVLSQTLTTQPTRVALESLLQDKRIRYTVGKFLSIVVTGSSAQYQSFLEQAVTPNFFRETGFGEMKQYCQQAQAQQMQKYDYGPIINQQLYGQQTPPVYNISQNFNFTNLYVISGGTDNLAPIGSVNRIMDSLYRRPDEHNFIPAYNHLDLANSFDNDIRVNIPLLRFLDTHQT